MSGKEEGGGKAGFQLVASSEFQNVAVGGGSDDNMDVEMLVRNQRLEEVQRLSAVITRRMRLLVELAHNRGNKQLAAVMEL